MPIPLSISELSTTPGSNSPLGTDPAPVLDDHQRTAYAFIRTLSDAKAAIADAVLLAGAQTVPGIKTFSNGLIGNVTGNASGTALNVTGTVALANGGTGATTAAAAFTAIKQPASETATGVSELMTNAEAQAGTDTLRVATGANLGATVLGMGQTWQAVGGSRALATTYTNTTGRTIMVAVALGVASAGQTVSATVNGTVIISSPSQGFNLPVVFVVPSGQTYSVNATSGFSSWAELR